jgi:GT2 family glycosyltransferase
VSSMVPWKIVHVDVSEGFPALPLERDYQGLYVVFWWRNIPLGHKEIPMALFPMSAAQLSTLAIQAITPAIGNHLLNQGFIVPLPSVCKNRPPDSPPDFEALRSLDRPLAMLDQVLVTDPQSSSESISVIVCTRDRPEQLERCLKSLQNLSIAPQEIVVVDSAPSSDATRNLVTSFPKVRYVLEPQPGLSRARNSGIAHTSGDVIAFTDDDVVVHPDWIWRLQQGFTNSRIMVVTGLAIAAELETESQWIFERRNSFNQGYRTRVFDTQFFDGMRYRGAPVWCIGAGANMAVRRKAIEQVGGFDLRLGAGAAGCSEDSELWYRVLAAGWCCLYQPTAVVYHYHRRDLESLKQQMYAYMRGHVAALLIQFEKYRHWGNLRRLFLGTPKRYTALFLKGLLNGMKPEKQTLGSEVLGCLAGIQFYLRTRLMGIDDRKPQRMSIEPYSSSGAPPTNEVQAN